MEIPSTPKSAEHYRAEAARLRREADGAQHESIRQQLIALAYGYDSLAETVELIARQRAKAKYRP
jgi:hypothetical protein